MASEVEAIPCLWFWYRKLSKQGTNYS